MLALNYNTECDVKIMLIVLIKLWINTYSVASFGVAAVGRLYGQVWRLITNLYEKFEEQGLIDHIFIVMKILTIYLFYYACNTFTPFGQSKAPASWHFLSD